ncbi:hypothetical protein DFH11DRAFT_1553799 [Phellopilus nigrolimitatus]|nr:hypothetical protein DFH11DRAFT_1553799 [Phellopilus nigrolimitatus]
MTRHASFFLIVVVVVVCSPSVSLSPSALLALAVAVAVAVRLALALSPSLLPSRPLSRPLALALALAVVLAVAIAIAVALTLTLTLVVALSLSPTRCRRVNQNGAASPSSPRSPPQRSPRLLAQLARQGQPEPAPLRLCLRTRRLRAPHAREDARSPHRAGLGGALAVVAAAAAESLAKTQEAVALLLHAAVSGRWTGAGPDATRGGRAGGRALGRDATRGGRSNNKNTKAKKKQSSMWWRVRRGTTRRKGRQRKQCKYKSNNRLAIAKKSRTPWKRGDYHACRTWQKLKAP